MRSSATGSDVAARGGTETQQRAQHRWTYAVFLAALLHDMGKAAHDLRITYDSAAQSNAAWNPLGGWLVELGASS